MDLTPQRIDEVEFRGSLRGYAREEVDDFLDRVSAEFRQLQEQLELITQRAARAEEWAAQTEDQIRRRIDTAVHDALAAAEHRLQTPPS